MKRLLAPVPLLVAVLLAACGGGDDSGPEPLVLTVTSPSGTVGKPLPVFEWAVDEGSGLPADRYEVRVFTSAETDTDDFDPTTSYAVADSGKHPGADRHTLAPSETFDGSPLEDHDYDAYVRVGRSSDGEGGWSEWDSAQFTIKRGYRDTYVPETSEEIRAREKRNLRVVIEWAARNPVSAEFACDAIEQLEEIATPELAEILDEELREAIELEVASRPGITADGFYEGLEDYCVG